MATADEKTTDAKTKQADLALRGQRLQLMVEVRKRFEEANAMTRYEPTGDEAEAR